MKSFAELGLEENILAAIKDLKFETPMPVQKEVIPHLLDPKGKDILALAQTGTGKTAAFGLPIVQKADSDSKNIQFLILSPTRELCLQISDDLAGFSKYKPGIRIAAVFGGANIERQIEKIKKGVQIISATPGRLLDLINRDIIDLSRIDTVVLDEADEMLNMGFREDLEEILRTTPKKKNVLLFSATMPKEIVAIANSYMKDPLEITIGRRNEGAENVEHICYLVHAKERYLALKRIVDYYPEIYGIVFCRTRKETQEVADQLIKDGYNADSLHGDLSQNQRDAVMKKFRIRHVQLLIATDVAARGLDVDDLTHIINYNLPEENEIYIHRSGRTGRAGRKGISIAIVNLKEKNKLHDIEKKMNKQFKFADIPLGKDICEKQLFHLIDRMEKVEVDSSQIEPYLPEIFRKLEWLDREELIKKFVSVEFNRFLEYYKKNLDLTAPSSSKSKGKSRESNFAFTRYFINIGFRDGLRPNTLMGIINEFTGTPDIEIGKIEILKNFSFFEIDSNYADTVFNSFNGKEYRGRELNLEISSSTAKENKGKREDKERSFDRGKGRKKDSRRSDSRFEGEKRYGRKEDSRDGDKKYGKKEDSRDGEKRYGRKEDSRDGEKRYGKKDDSRDGERKREKKRNGSKDESKVRDRKRSDVRDGGRNREGKKEWERFAEDRSGRKTDKKEKKQSRIDKREKREKKEKEGFWTNLNRKKFK